MLKQKTASENIRPWGHYDVIDRGKLFQVKRIVVEPGQSLSYQRHKKRDEYWVVVEGKAQVTLDGVVAMFDIGQIVIVPRGTKHRVKNPGRRTLMFIETQIGSYLGEDDIERFEDEYGRV
jgi:mannose-6-phosphate isomerase-like protein (cupin superfamily)